MTNVAPENTSNSAINRIEQHLQKTVLGCAPQIRLLIMCLLSKGHALIQGDPGLGKTTLVKALAQSIDCSFSRIQFTPDLLPSDILGYSIFDPAETKFKFIEGPIFNNLVLADEINRTNARVQSALLESMNEQQVSMDGISRQLHAPFMVIATQNNRFKSGTFPLPEPQLDRFLMSITINLPDVIIQEAILRLHMQTEESKEETYFLHANDVIRMQKDVSSVKAGDSTIRYIIQLCEAIRTQNSSSFCLSTRASIALMKAAQSCAYLQNRTVAYPDDVKEVFIPVMSHRLPSDPLSNGNGFEADLFLEKILHNVRIP